MDLLGPDPEMQTIQMPITAGRVYAEDKSTVHSTGSAGSPAGEY